MSKFVARRLDFRRKILLAAAGMIAAITLPSPIPGRGLVWAQSKPGGLNALLRQMDSVSLKFKSAQADIRLVNYSKATNGDEERTGMVYFLRQGTSLQMGLEMLPQPSQIVEFKDGKFRVFNPSTNHLDEIDAAGKNLLVVQAVVSLGFGESGRALENGWTIDDQGTEQMTDGSKNVMVERLDLVSRDDNVRKYCAHITIWIDPTRAVMLKEILFEASDGKATGDLRTTYYTNIRINQSIDLDAYAIKCRGRCK